MAEASNATTPEAGKPTQINLGDVVNNYLEALQRVHDVIIYTLASERLLNEQEYDLVLTDLAMLVTSGVVLIREIKRNPALWRIPVVAVTAHWMAKIRTEASTACCDGFIAKPFSTQELLHEVAKHLALGADPMR